MEKCKLALSIPGKNLRLDMPLEDAEFWFSTLASVLLEQKETKEVKDQRLDSAPQETEVEKVTRHKSVIGIKESRAPLDNQEAYKGFCASVVKYAEISGDFVPKSRYDKAGAHVENARH